MADRKFDARPDSMDFRDRMFIPTLVEVSPERPLDRFAELDIPVLDQGREGACTGFALATICNYLLKTVPDSTWDGTSVSARMLYTMAKRYDEWKGTDYDGSSARGAMKGWQKHGVCSSDAWSNNPNSRAHNRDHLTVARAEDAALRPLGAYFRVNHKDLVAMHTAINEVHVLFATSLVHSGWDDVAEDGIIHRQDEMLGGHAFAIVGYDSDGFWIQNSWGADWGYNGFCHLSYADWLANGMDVWVARLGVPVSLEQGARTAGRLRGASTSLYSFNELRRHVISVGNDGLLRNSGQFGTTEENVRELFDEHIPKKMQDWENPRILVYAHGGLVSEKDAVETIKSNLVQLLHHEVYPICFVWKTDFWTTISNILRDALRRRKSEGIIDAAKEFMLDRLDDALEPLSSLLGGKALWTEMKENALLATTADDGAARIVAEYLAGFSEDNELTIHLVAHSAGSIFLAPFAQLLASPVSGINQGPMKNYRGFGIDVKTCHLWAPACTIDLFKDTYLPLADSNSIESLALYTLTDEAERDDNCENVYHKSLLYLVSNAFEDTYRIPVFRPDGEPILGMQKFIDKDKQLKAAIDTDVIRHILSPNEVPADRCDAARAVHHGDFDNDVQVRLSTLDDIIGECVLEPSVLPVETPERARAIRASMNRDFFAGS